MKTKIVADLAEGQALALSGPGLINLQAASSVTISKVAACKVLTGSTATVNSLQTGLSVLLPPILGPAVGLGIMGLGALWLLREFSKKDESRLPVKV